MAMKQTQTKLFDFSDVGLDFCAGSKNLFPDRFKRMLVLGYNLQTVTSVSVAGNQVTFEYGVSHGYVADRVLKVSSGPLAAINDGEFVIDSVTATSLTMTIDTAPISIAGGFTTVIAPLGWELVYEQANIHVYRFKNLDESDVFIRLCFQNIATRRNCISPCIGNSFEMNSGFITDDFSLSPNKAILSPGIDFKWEFGSVAANTHDNWTYTQGYSTYGIGRVVGSKYHFAIMSNGQTGTVRTLTNGIFPNYSLEINLIKYPMILGYIYGSITSVYDTYEARNSAGFMGNVRVTGSPYQGSSFGFLDYGNNVLNPSENYLSSLLDGFNTTVAEPVSIYEYSTGQKLGGLYGIYRVLSASKTLFPNSYQLTPSFTKDIDLNNDVLVHCLGSGNSEGAPTTLLCVPVEEIKHVN